MTRNIRAACKAIEIAAAGIAVGAALIGSVAYGFLSGLAGADPTDDTTPTED